VLSYANVSIARLNAQIRRIRILVVGVFADSPVSQDGIPQLLAFLLLQLYVAAPAAGTASARILVYQVR
jgi:hypothetical protein